MLLVNKVARFFSLHTKYKTSMFNSYLLKNINLITSIKFICNYMFFFQIISKYLICGENNSSKILVYKIKLLNSSIFMRKRKFIIFTISELK